MASRKKVFLTCLVIFTFCICWLATLKYVYTSDLLERSIDLSNNNSYEWEVRSLRSNNYDLVVRLHKTTGPPYDYVIDIIKNSKYRDASLKLSWQLLAGQETLFTGNQNTYGNHFRATNPYVDKGIGKIRLTRGETYVLKVQVNEPATIFNQLEPEVRITPTVATTDWVFGQTLIWGLISIVMLVVMGLMLLANLWLRACAANKRMQSDAAKPRR
jgi:hypothetical protein